ncbi:hypothetical protein MK489_14405 [Myxococcota bacterium]|nr:hypothetical protein [Myxococcota bacterium]
MTHRLQSSVFRGAASGYTQIPRLVPSDATAGFWYELALQRSSQLDEASNRLLTLN